MPAPTQSSSPDDDLSDKLVRLRAQYPGDSFGELGRRAGVSGGQAKRLLGEARHAGKLDSTSAIPIPQIASTETDGAYGRTLRQRARANEVLSKEDIERLAEKDEEKHRKRRLMYEVSNSLHSKDVDADGYPPNGIFKKYVDSRVGRAWRHEDREILNRLSEDRTKAPKRAIGTVSERTGRPRKQHSLHLIGTGELQRLHWNGDTYFSRTCRRMAPYIKGKDSDSDESYAEVPRINQLEPQRDFFRSVR